MNAVIQVQGRDAIAARALPFVTSWFLGPEELAASLSKNGKSSEIQRLKAYQLDDGEVKIFNPSVWVTVEFDIHSLATSLGAKQGEFSEWQHRAVLKFPAAAFVWKDEFELWFTQSYLDEDSSVDLLENLNPAIVGLDYSPLVAAKFQDAVMEGFPLVALDTAPAIQAAPLGTVSVPGGVGSAKAGPVPVEHGLLTKEIAHAFAGVFGWTAARWTKNLSAAKWINPCRIGRGEQGGASAVWRPLLLAQLIHGKIKGDKAKEKALNLLNSRFARIPSLAPWRDDWAEYSATFCADD